MSRYARRIEEDARRFGGEVRWPDDEWARTPEQVRWCEDRVRQTMAEFQRNRVAA